MHIVHCTLYIVQPNPDLPCTTRGVVVNASGELLVFSVKQNSNHIFTATTVNWGLTVIVSYSRHKSTE